MVSAISLGICQDGRRRSACMDWASTAAANEEGEVEASLIKVRVASLRIFARNVASGATW
jgi:hypothetical protein